MMASINLIPASSGHHTHNQIPCKFPFPCQLASKSASALNDKSVIMAWFYNTLGQGITCRQPFSQRAHSLTLPCWRKGWISLIGWGPLLSWNTICIKLFHNEEPLGVFFKWQVRAHIFLFLYVLFNILMTSHFPFIFSENKATPPPCDAELQQQWWHCQHTSHICSARSCLVPQNSDHL